MIRYRRELSAMPMRSLHKTMMVGALVLCLAVAVAAFAYTQQQQRNIREVAERFDRLKNRVLDEIELRMRLYEYGLQGTRGMIAAVGNELSWSSFVRYSSSRNFEREFPGARGFGFIRRVSPEDEAQFIGRAKDELGPDFALRQLGPHDGDKYIIQYIEPLERNMRVLGLDIASDPVRKAAAIAAMHSASTTLSASVNLLQDGKEDSLGILLLLPVYRYGMPTNTEVSRELALLGWVYAPLQMDEVLRNLDAEDNFFSMSLKDRFAPEGALLYGSTPETVEGYPRQPKASLVLFGREWEVDLQPTPSFIESLHLQNPQRKAMEAGLFALLTSALVVSVTYLGQRKRVQRLEQARRAAIVEGSEDAIIVQTLQGVITDWNDGARRLFGFNVPDVLGHTAQELLVPKHLREEDEFMLAQVAKGEHVKAYETLRSHRDGRLIEVSISAGPIVDADGQVVGMAKTLRDVREARAAARRVAELNATLEDQVRERTLDLETARHALQTVLDAMPSQIGYWDRGLRNRVANRAYGDWFHIDAKAVHGMHLRELIGEEMFNVSLPYAEAALRGEARSFEQTRPASETEPVRHMLVHYLPDEQEGEIKGFYAFVHDVTELTEGRMQLAAAQRDNAALLQTLNLHAIVSVADRAGRILEANDAFCRVSGYTREELLGQNHRIVNSGEHDRAFWMDMWRTISSGESWHAEVCNRTKDGELYWVDSVVAPFMDAKGRVEKYVSIRTDITDRKRTELELQRTLALLRAVLEASTQVAIVATDRRGIVSLLNRGAELLLDTAADTVVGRQNALGFFEAEGFGPVPAAALQGPHPEGVDDDGLNGGALEGAAPGTGLVPSAPLPGAFGAMRRLVQFHRATQDPLTQWFMVRGDGGRVPVSLAVTRMQDGEGRFSGYLGIASDIRLRLQQEQTLREAMQQANAANEAKSRFLANMSHEIRTPMNAVLGLSHLLARTALNDEQQGMLRRVQVAGKALLAVINDILDLSKIEAGEMALERVPVDVNQVVRDVAALIEMQARDKGVAFVVDADEPVPQPLEGDSTRLQQILINLLSNAIKFTERGEVRLTVRHQALGSGTFRVQMSVSDTGIGIDEEARKRLFAPFVQADLSTTRRYGGTGLGLSIVKQLIEMMHGTVEVFSTLGKGSQFVVTLPMHRSMGLVLHRDAAQPQFTGPGLPGVRLLVVDDNETNQEIAVHILQAEGAVVAVAGHGQAALDMLQASPDDFDAVLMDVHMPVLNGLDATRQIRASVRLAGLPVIGLTAGVSLSEQKEAIGAGMNAVVGKPFDPAALVRTLWRSLPHLAQGVDTAARASDPSGGSPGGSGSSDSSEVPADWPSLPGVSAEQSHTRLKGHAPLLWQLARRIVACVDGLPSETSATSRISKKAAFTEAEMDAMKLPLHDLKGMAGSIGAQTLHTLAAQAEDAARQHEPEALAQLLPQLRPAVQGWDVALAQSQSVAPQFTGGAGEANEAGGADGADSAQGPQASEAASARAASAMDAALLGRIALLRGALQQRDLAALDEWEAVAPDMGGVLGRERHAALQQHLDALAFDEALAVLDSALSGQS